MDRPQPHRFSTGRRSGATDAACSPAGEATASKVVVNDFDHIDLAAFLEEFLSIKIDEVAGSLERTIGDRLLDLVEANQRLTECLEALTTRGGTLPAEVAEDPLPASNAHDDGAAERDDMRECLRATAQDIELMRRENDSLRAQLREAEKRAVLNASGVDEPQDKETGLNEHVDEPQCETTGLKEHVLTEQVAVLQKTAKEHTEERDRAIEAAREAASRLSTLEEKMKKDIASAEARQHEAEKRLLEVERELRAEIEILNAKKSALIGTLRTYADPEKFHEAKLREMHQQIEALNATMREKDSLLQEAGKEHLQLVQELEKVRKEKYEGQVTYERRIRELQDSLHRETREKENERQERHQLEEHVARARKKWPLW